MVLYFVCCFDVEGRKRNGEWRPLLVVSQGYREFISSKWADVIPTSSVNDVIPELDNVTTSKNPLLPVAKFNRCVHET